MKILKITKLFLLKLDYGKFYQILFLQASFFIFYLHKFSTDCILTHFLDHILAYFLLQIILLHTFFRLYSCIPSSDYTSAYLLQIILPHTFFRLYSRIPSSDHTPAYLLQTKLPHTFFRLYSRIHSSDYAPAYILQIILPHTFFRLYLSILSSEN